MKVNNLNLPEKLIFLVNSNVWFLDDINSVNQYGKSLSKRNLVEKLTKDELDMYLYKPPFLTAKQQIEFGHEIELYLCDGTDLDGDLIIILGDFGIGSDAYWGLLYASEDDVEPKVIREKWGRKPNTACWEIMSNNFSSLCKSLSIML